ncbi:MAG: AIR synthase-related protein, partial [Terriglobales bacterium]
ALHKCLLEAIHQGLVESAHDCSEGGLAVALAECGFPGDLGARLQLDSGGLPAEVVLFGEDASRVLLSCAEKNVERIRELAVRYGIAADAIGETASDNLEIFVDGRPVVAASVSELKQAWEQALEQALDVAAPQMA